MNKKLIALAVAGALATPMAAQADATVSGFADIFWTLTDDNPASTNGVGGSSTEGQFSVSEVEFDFESNGVRVDVQSQGGVNTIEQAKFTTELGPVSLTAGQFNSKLGDDNSDAPDMKFSSHSLVYEHFNDTVNGGTGADSLINVAGVNLGFAAGPANIDLAYVNDPTTDPQTATVPDAGNAVILMVSGSFMEGLDVEASLTSTEAVDFTDINFNYTLGGLMVGLDYMTSDTADAYSFDIGFDMGNGIAVKARVDNWENDAGTTTIDTTTIAASYELADNVLIVLENYTNDDGATDYSTTTVEFVATF